MPYCKKCEWYGPTIEFRRSPKEGYLCKDRMSCKRRRKKLRDNA